MGGIISSMRPVSAGGGKEDHRPHSSSSSSGDERTSVRPLPREERRAKVRELRAGMQRTLDLLRKCKEANRENLLGGALEDAPLQPLDDAMPYIKMAASLAAEAAIPPPGGQCVQIALEVAHRVIKELATNQVMMELAEACMDHMMLALDDHKILALETDPAIKNVFEKFKACIAEVQAFIWETAGNDSFWFKRLLLLPATERRLGDFYEDLTRVSSLLDLGLNMGSYAFLSTAHQAKEDVKYEVSQLLSRYYPECKTVQDLWGHKDAKNELMGIMGSNLGEYKVTTLAAIDHVVERQGAHTLLRNKVLRRLWSDVFSYQEQVSWSVFWQAFPQSLPDEAEKGALMDFFKHEQNKKLFELVVDHADPLRVDIAEINSVFNDDASIIEQVNERIVDYIHNRGAVNQVSRLLSRLPKDLVRPDQHKLKELLQQKRLVVVQGALGEGKFIAACQAGQALFRPAKDADPATLPGHFQAIYTAELTGANSKDSLYSRIRDCFDSIPRDGACDDQIQAALSTMFAMDTEEHPYNVLLILNHAEEIPDGPLFEDFCARLKDILFKSGSNGLEPSNFTVALSSRSDQARLAHWDCAVFKDCYVDFTLEPLPVQTAAKILQAEIEHHGKKVEVSDEQALKLAESHGKNPQLLKILAGSLDTTFHLNLALKSPIKQVVKGAFNDMLLSCLEKLGNALPTLMVVVDTMPAVFSPAALSKVLVGWYQTEDEDEHNVAVHDDLRMMKQLNVVHVRDSQYSVVPLIRDFVRFLISNPSDNELIQNHIGRVNAARRKVSQSYVAFTHELLESTFDTSMRAYKSAYQEMCANKPYIQSALLKVKDHEQLRKDEGVLHRILEMLSLMVYIPILYDMELIQEICLGLAEQHPRDQLFVGCCMSAVSAFYRFGLDERHGHEASLKRADKAIGLLTTQSSNTAKMARAVAFRFKGLILRDLYRDLDVAVECHRDAVRNLKPIMRGQKAKLEITLNLAALSGTKDWIGGKESHEEGIQAGRAAIDLATMLLTEGKGKARHPVTALALEALGYNLRNSGDPQGAFDVHKQAYDIRSYVLGENHAETSMSLQQLGLCQQDMGHMGHFEMIHEAEKSLKKSLSIRRRLERTNRMVYLIANSHENLARLYLSTCGNEDLGRKEMAITCFRLTIDTRLPVLRKDHKKIQGPCKTLVDLLNSMGRTEEAQEYKSKCELGAKS